MRIEIRDKHNNVIFYVDEKEIEGVGFKTLLYIRDGEVSAFRGSPLYEIKDDRVENRIDRETYIIQGTSARGGKKQYFYNEREIRSGGNMLLRHNKPIGFGLAIVLAVEYETGRAFERGMSDLEKFGVLLGGTEMIRALERDGFSMKNLIGLGFYHNLSPEAQNKLLIALGTKAAIQRGLSLRKLMKLAAFRALEKNVQKATIKAYAGYRFLKKGDFSLLTKMLIASGFDEYTRIQFVKFYAAKEFFDERGVLVEPEAEISQVPEQPEVSEQYASGQHTLQTSVQEDRTSIPIMKAPKRKSPVGWGLAYGFLGATGLPVLVGRVAPGSFGPAFLIGLVGGFVVGYMITQNKNKQISS